MNQSTNTTVAADATASIPSDLISTLDSWKNPVIIGHVRPDADCFGSMLAMALTWPAENGPAKVSLPPGSESRRLWFLTEWANAQLAEPADVMNADGIVVVDTAKASRCNVDPSIRETWADSRDIINIDHHESNTMFGAINYVDHDAGSACELVYRIIREAGRDIDPIVASLLYAGIHSDTIGFSLPTTRASALRAAADMVECGARVEEIGERLCRALSESEFNLERIIYGNTKLVADGRISYSTASHDEIIGAGCTSADIDDQVSIPRSLVGIDMGILFTEGKPRRTRLNLRGERGLDVLPFALTLGGGGHQQSAGAIIDGTVDEAVAKVLPKAIAYLDEKGR